MYAIRSYYALRGFLVKSFELAIGTNVRAMNKDASSEQEIVRAISLNISAVKPLMNTIGRNTDTVVNVDAVIAPATCFAPCTAAFLVLLPSLV